MCFSASASFIAGSVLLVGGAASIKYAKEPKQIPFAAIPLVFAVQQFSEGVLWLSLMDADWAKFTGVATYSFTVIAQIVWPIWMSLSLWLIENNKKKKKILFVLMLIGVAVSFFYGLHIIRYPINATIASHHIQYNLDNLRGLHYYLGIFYFFPTVIASMVSSLKYLKIFAVVIFLSYIITQMFFYPSVISVWCFFAAIISLFIIYIMRHLNACTVK